MKLGPERPREPLGHACFGGEAYEEVPNPGSLLLSLQHSAHLGPEGLVVRTICFSFMNISRGTSASVRDLIGDATMTTHPLDLDSKVHELQWTFLSVEHSLCVAGLPPNGLHLQ